MARRTTAKTGAKRTAPKPKGRRSPSASATKARKAVGKAGKGARAAKKVTTGARPKAKRPSATSARSARSRATAAKVAAPKKPAVRKVSKKSARPKRNLQTTAPPEATSQDPIQFTEEAPLPKTHLTAKELREFRELLLVKRSELAGDVRRLADEALYRKGHGDGEHSTMPIHMADLGTDNWEQEFTLGLLANEESLVREIDEALSRVEKKTYGVCLATHKKISKARLRAKPWAKFCIEYARAREEGRAI